jgi:hypothetical protein
MLKRAVVVSAGVVLAWWLSLPPEKEVPAVKIDFFTHSHPKAVTPPEALLRRHFAIIDSVPREKVKPSRLVSSPTSPVSTPIDLRCVTLANFAVGIANLRFVGVDTAHHPTARWVTSTIDTKKIPGPDTKVRFYDLCLTNGFDTIPRN